MLEWNFKFPPKRKTALPCYGMLQDDRLSKLGTFGTSGVLPNRLLRNLGRLRRKSCSFRSFKALFVSGFQNLWARSSINFHYQFLSTHLLSKPKPKPDRKTTITVFLCTRKYTLASRNVLWGPHIHNLQTQVLTRTLCGCIDPRRHCESACLCSRIFSTIKWDDSKFIQPE